MVDYELVFTDDVLKDSLKIKRVGLKNKVQNLLDIIRKNPFQNPPRYEKLQGNLSGAYSRRINQKHRLVYSINQEEHYITILKMWSHYGE
jgi:Txe/YoeB family toxin of toxin-antitoxin system